MPESEITIRRATPDDRAAAAGLWMRLLDEHTRLDSRFEVAGDARRRWENDYLVWLRDGTWRFFVAEAGGALVGLISAHRWAPPPVYAYTEEVYVNDLFVHPDARAQGVGARLLEAVQTWAEELQAARIRIGVLAENEAGRAFWEGRGARPFSITYTLELAPAAGDRGRKKARRLGF